MSIPAVVKEKNNNGEIEYNLQFDPAWEGFDSFIAYLQKHWGAVVSETSDNVYSRRWVLQVDGVPITVLHDSQKGNSFLREDGVSDQNLLEEITKDLIHRMN